jgi:hypothetical protein
MKEKVTKLESEGKTLDEEEATRMAMEMVENAFDMMWKITIVDIQSTIDEVAEFVLAGKDLVSEFGSEAHDKLDIDEFSRPSSFSGGTGSGPSSPAMYASGVRVSGGSANSSNSAGPPSPGAPRQSVSSVSSSIRNNLMSPSTLASKLTLDNLEKGLERFLLPKKEHTEGKAVRKREDILHARATGLKRLGKIFMQIGQEASNGADGVGQPAGGMPSGAPASPNRAPAEPDAAVKESTDSRAGSEHVDGRRTTTSPWYGSGPRPGDREGMASGASR